MEVQFSLFNFSHRNFPPPSILPVDNSGYMGIKDMYHKVNMAQNKHILIGQLGENIAAKYLENRKFRLIERNFRKKFGEIDIVVEKNNVLHFIEVKSASFSGVVPKEGEEAYRPEDHVYKNKKERLSRVIQAYVLERRVTQEWSVDVVVVHINQETRKAHVRILENVLLN